MPDPMTVSPEQRTAIAREVLTAASEVLRKNGFELSPRFLARYLDKTYPLSPPPMPPEAAKPTEPYTVTDDSGRTWTLTNNGDRWAALDRSMSNWSAPINADNSAVSPSVLRACADVRERWIKDQIPERPVVYVGGDKWRWANKQWQVRTISSWAVQSIAPIFTAAQLRALADCADATDLWEQRYGGQNGR